jgi:aspartyl/asparaginyl beta-hydroxylase (cupin superfamily)
MNTPANDPRSLAQAGVEALRKGDAARARELLSGAVAGGLADVPVLLALAYACRALKDERGKIAVVDRVLAVDRGNVRALIMKGDHLAESGDEKAAASFHLQALKLAPPANQAPPDLVQELRRVQAACQRYARQYESFLAGELQAAGFDPAKSSPRFAQSLDILLGRRQIFVQEPRYFYFPGLPQIQFYERQQFPWLDAVEAATDDIRSELLEVMREDGAFEPYLKSDPSRPYKPQDGMIDNPDWGAFYLWKNGELQAENAARCPRTLKALEGAPLARFPNRSPSVLFSLLKPGAKIPPHNGLANTRLICHLPLIIPPDCGFRVGNEVREWREGEAWVFDDSINHEAWNRSDRTRVILLFDIQRPEMSEQENALVSALFAAVDRYSGAPPEWDT